MTSALRLPVVCDDTDWPDDDTVILRSRGIRAEAGAAASSQFGDDVWHLTAAHPDAHISVSPLRWRRFPPPLRRAFKAFFLAALDHPYPPGPGIQRAGERPSVATLQYWIIDLLVFAAWLADRDVCRLCDVTDGDLDAYRTHVLGLARGPGRKADILAVVRTMWLYRNHMPQDARLGTAYPWAGTASKDLVALPHPGRENKTPRIAPATMDALLAWALRMIEDFGPDIADAWTEYQHLDRGIHPDQATFVGTLGERLPVFLQRARLAGTALPGKPDGCGVTVNYGHVVRLVGIPEAQRAGLSRGQQRMIMQAGLPVAADTYLGTVTGQVDGRPWRDTPLTLSELPTLVRLLVAASFLTVCFLSGMRPGEVLNLRQGCRDTDPETGELLIRGRRGKGFDRTPVTPDRSEPECPWVVVQPVHDAIGLLERLGPSTLLFPASLTSAHTTRPNHSNARSSAAINRDLEDFLAWVNTTFSHPDGEQPIPPDPTKHLHGSRLRRTLAHFIVRRPRGLIAAALQYGHVNTKVTLTYAGNADTSWMEDLAVERLELILEQTEQDTARLADGEHVSGPSADGYRARTARTARSAHFAGRVVSGVRNVERLLTQTDANIHHGDAMTCVWRAATAACRQSTLAAGLPANDGPDESQCQSACLNLAYTDRDIDEQRRRLVAWSAEATDPLAPHPLRDRAGVLAERAGLIIARHEGAQTSGTDDCREGA